MATEKYHDLKITGALVAVAPTSSTRCVSLLLQLHVVLHTQRCVSYVSFVSYVFDMFHFTLCCIQSMPSSYATVPRYMVSSGAFHAEMKAGD